MTHIWEKINNNLDTFHKNRETIFGYSGFTGVFISFVSLAVGLFLDWDITYIITVIALSSNILFLTFLCVYLTRRYDSSTKQADELKNEFVFLKKQLVVLKDEIENAENIQWQIAQTAHNISHEYRKVTNKILSDLFSNNFSFIKDRENSFRNFIQFLLTNTKTIFDVLTKNSCSVCIKLIDDDYNVTTYMRDPVSYCERDFTDRKIPSYSYSQNTAFLRILSPDYDDNFFISNDLQELSNRDEYINYNPRWKKYYNCSLVVPIRVIINKGNNEYYYIGFMCVDNKQGGLDENVGFNLLAAFADMIFNLFQSFNTLKEKNNAERQLSQNWYSCD